MPSWRSGSPSSRGTESRGSGDDRGHREDTVGSSQGLSPCVNQILTNTRFHNRNVRVFNLFRPHSTRPLFIVAGVFATEFCVG
jgi:hypothetical protein